MLITYQSIINHDFIGVYTHFLIYLFGYITLLFILFSSLLKKISSLFKKKFILHFKYKSINNEPIVIGVDIYFVMCFFSYVTLCLVSGLPT